MKSKFARRFTLSLVLVGTILAFNACQNALEPVAPGASRGRLAVNFDFYVLTDNNRLLKLNTQNPTAILSTINVTGLPTGELLKGIDFRPATGQLYGLGSGSRLYSINLTSGAATMMGAGAFSPALVGDGIGIDFNPTVDRLRVVTNAGQNLRINPENGAVVAVDGNINGIMGAQITSAAYTNNRAGVTTTTLYDIDPITDKLYRQNPPNDGRLEEVGSLGVDIAGTGSFDIGPDGSAIATLISGVTQGLYHIDLTTGRAERLGGLPNVSVVGLAIPTEPVAYAVTQENALLIFNPFAPTPISKAITGLQSGEGIYGIDFRPANGQLYALGSTSRLYTINTANGVATPVGTGSFSPGLPIGDYGFDFNPTIDRIRVVNHAGQNLRLNPNDGSIAGTDAMLVFAPANPSSVPPNVTGVAYTNNFAGATTTTLLDVDTRTGNSTLFRQDLPNSLVAIGSLNSQMESANGFDIGGATNMAYALLRSGGTTRLYTINTTTGAASVGLALPGNPVVRGFAVGLGF